MDEQKLLRQLQKQRAGALEQAVARNRTAEAMRKQNVYLPLEDDTLITLDRLWEQMVEKERCAAVAQAMRALGIAYLPDFNRFSTREIHALPGMNDDAMARLNAVLRAHGVPPKAYPLL